jgi:hypothetical protein
VTNFFPSGINSYSTVSAYVAGIPGRIRQGDSAMWYDVPFGDVNGVTYDSGTYTLKYTLAGPAAAPLILTAVPNSNNWQTTLTPTQSGGLVAGLYWWQAQVFATNVRVTLAEGEFTVETDLALATEGFDARTTAEKALAAAEAALSVFQASGGRVQAYSIGNRHMAFQRDADILAVIKYWRARVIAEQSVAVGGMDRLILQGFRRAR